MIFTSGTQAIQGRTVNHDPQPWILLTAQMRFAHPSQAGHMLTGPIDSYKWSRRPRPEFAVLDNPILADVRFHLEHRRTDTIGDVYREWFSYVENEDPTEWSEDVTPEQLNHAKRVLTRLAQWKDN